MAKVHVNDKASKLADLQANDEVVVTYEKTAKNLSPSKSRELASRRRLSQFERSTVLTEVSYEPLTVPRYVQRRYNAVNDFCIVEV